MVAWFGRRRHSPSPAAHPYGGLIRTVLFLCLLSIPAQAEVSATSYTCEQEDFERFVVERCFKALNRGSLRRSIPDGFPHKSERQDIARGLIDGQRRFYPLRPQVKMQLLAFSMCETEGNPIDVPTRWGYEVGWTGWNVNILRGAAAFYGLDFPRSDRIARGRLKRDHRWAGYITLAACAAHETDIGGIEHAFYVKTHGFKGFLRELHLHGPVLRTWPSTQRYQKWMTILEAAYGWDGQSPIAARLEAAGLSASPLIAGDRRTR